LPHVGVFEAVSIAKHIFILTNAIAQAAMHEQRPIDLRGYQAAIILPAYIRVPVYFKSGQSIISQRNPEVTEEFTQGPTHLFEELTPVGGISARATTLAALLHLVPDNPSIEKLFLIRKSGHGAGSLEYVIIRLRQGYVSMAMGVYVDVFYLDTTTQKSYVIKASSDSFSNFWEKVPIRAPVEVSPAQLVNLSLMTVERFARAEFLSLKGQRTPQETALVQEFEAFKKNPTLPRLFDILAEDLKRSAHVEGVEKQKSLATILQERDAKAKPLPGAAGKPQ
jgi:hypothetical protein